MLSSPLTTVIMHHLTVNFLLTLSVRSDMIGNRSHLSLWNGNMEINYHITTILQEWEIGMGILTESHVKHPICFIKDEICDSLKVSSFDLDQIYKSSWGGY